MKKALSFLLFLSLIFTLAACDDKVTPVVVKTDQEKVLEAKEELTLGDISALLVDITLPTTGLNDSTVTWTSDNESIITAAGIVTRPLFESGDGYGQLIASITVGEITVQKVFSATVIKLDEVIIVIDEEGDLAFDLLNLTLGDVSGVTEKLALPGLGEKKSRITWASSDERLIDLKGRLNRPGFDEGDADVTLTATLIKGEYTDTKTFVVTVAKEDENLVTSTVAMPFESLADEYIVSNGTLDIHYVNGGDLPYVDIQEFITLLTGAIISDDLEVVGVENTLTVSYTVTDEDTSEEFVYYTEYNFLNNTLKVNDFSFFDGISESTQTDFGSGLSTVDYVETDPDIVMVDLDDYNFDFIRHDGKYLIPFHFANLFYSGGMYDAYYNGDKVYGVDTYQLMDDDSVSDTVLTSSKTTEDMPLDIREATYNYLAFIFDYFYGLKEEKGIESFYDTLSVYRGNYISQDDATAYSATFRFAYSLDDLHTSHMFAGYYEDYEIQLTLSDLGPKTTNYYETSWDLEDACDAKQPYRTLDNDTIGVIFIEGFEAETPDEFEASLNALLALGTIESIVVDLSCNGGGILGSAFQILGFLTDEPIGIHSRETTDGSTDSWYMDTENVAADVDWYILTSTLTFSAANLTTSVAKDMGIATIIGTPSSGGACSITAMLLPDGSGIMISSTGMLTNNRYESIEAGISVDIAMDDVTDFEELATLINAN